MINTFDNGWSGNFVTKQIEQRILSSLLKSFNDDSSRCVVINSTWYTNDYHNTVLEYLNHQPCTHLVLVAMLDTAIPKFEWFNHINCEKIGVGYYPGDVSFDFWAIVLKEFYKPIDIQLLTDASNIDTAYMCLNRKPHWHHVKLYQQLEDFNLIDKGLISLGSETGHPKLLKIDEGYTDIAPNPGTEQYGINNDIVSLGHMSNWSRHFLNIVTETTWNITKNHFVSEKIYKPIVGCRPFLVYDPDGAVSWLTSRGFETYTNDFTDISDLDLSLGVTIPEFLKVLCEQPRSYWQHKYIALKEKILYNKNHFDTYVNQQYQIIEKGIPCQI